MNLLRNIKRMIIKCGIPPSHRLDFFNALLSLGKWLREHPAPVHLETRENLYDHVIGLLKGEPFDYLEAGVFRGDSIRYWAKHANNPGIRFFGFDTFTGLPEAWHTGLKTFEAGHFHVDGAFPEIQDERVRFVKGRFQDTLPGFLQTFKLQKQLVIHCDADIYTSELYFLTVLHPFMPAGTILLFDNFSVATHDFRAFCDYTSSYAREFEVIATAEVDFEKIAIRLK